MTVCRFCKAETNAESDRERRDAVAHVRADEPMLDEGEACEVCGFTRDDQIGGEFDDLDTSSIPSASILPIDPDVPSQPSLQAPTVEYDDVGELRSRFERAFDRVQSNHPDDVTGVVDVEISNETDGLRVELSVGADARSQVQEEYGGDPFVAMVEAVEISAYDLNRVPKLVSMTDGDPSVGVAFIPIEDNWRDRT